MDNSSDPPVRSTTDAQSAPARARLNDGAIAPEASGRRTRLPSFRASAALAVSMLTVGVGVGAAIGPTPASSLAGTGGVVQKLPALIASIAARARVQAAQTPAQTATTTQPPAVKSQATPAASTTPTSASSTPAPASTTPTTSGESETKSSKPTKSSSGGGSNVPPITSVWLIELAGGSISEPLANAAAAPYITGQLVPKGTLLSGWSALSASAFASDAALVEHKASVGGTPPVLHTIVQPPCPEGAAGASCLTGTPGALTAADQFLQATLTSITSSTTYTEHGLIVVTFATVADPASVELPAGATSSSLASTPPAGAVLLSPFAKAGARSSVVFNPTSPKQSLEKLLH
jgi:hypothetical protein